MPLILVKNLTRASDTDLAVIFLSGIASGYLVLASIIVKIHMCPDLVFGKGPTQSIMTLSNDCPHAGIGISGATLIF